MVTEATAELWGTGHSTLMRAQQRTIPTSFHLLTERETTPGRMTLMGGNRVSGMGVIMGLLTQGMGVVRIEARKEKSFRFSSWQHHFIMTCYGSKNGSRAEGRVH